jgi:hypothetical protein
MPATRCIAATEVRMLRAEIRVARISRNVRN